MHCNRQRLVAAMGSLWVCDNAAKAHCVGAGAAKGIGLACASCLGHEGAKVVVADLDEEGAKRYITIKHSSSSSSQQSKSA